ncbi:MAG: signal peptidase I [Planctomycetota bacterium]|nr:signal peptidase I [Planctomycetota bacterium]
MSRKANAPSPASSGQDEPTAMLPHSGTRETVESLVVAIVLAFLFRGFVAEAFVIPTGSMATTLFGRHNDVQCPECDYWYQTGASAENEDRRSGEVLATTCPICRFRMELDKSHEPNHRSFDGDRILVSKFDYDLAEPSRWDVFVFKYPANAKQNYIKRLVGLPNEELKIRHGDVYTRPFSGVASTPADEDALLPLAAPEQTADLPAAANSAPWQIQRKPEHKVRAMMQVIHDTDTRYKKLADAGWPARWQQWSAEAGWPDQLVPCSADGELPLLDARQEEQWLRYRHFVPRPDDWAFLARKKLPPGMLFMKQDPSGARRADQLRIGYQAKGVGDFARALAERLQQEGFLVSIDSGPRTIQTRQAEAQHADVPFLADIIASTSGDPHIVLYNMFNGGESIRWEDGVEPLVELLHRLILPQRRHGALISDFYAYNAYHLQLPRQFGFGAAFTDVRKYSGYHWVGDLVVECKVKVTGSGTLKLMLVEGGVRYGCDIDIAKQIATLSINEGEGTFGDPPAQDAGKVCRADISLREGRFYRLRFANVDNQLLFWINDKLVQFDSSTVYHRSDSVEPHWSERDPGDAAPVALGGDGVQLQFEQMRLLRDVYYVAQDQSFFPNKQHEYRFRGVGFPALDSEQISLLLARPPEWSATHLFQARDEVMFQLAEDQFFPMGDNSPESLDGRLWEACPKFVDRELLLGKALLIYWPHNWRSSFHLGSFHFPVPNLRRMGLIR